MYHVRWDHVRFWSLSWTHGSLLLGNGLVILPLFERVWMFKIVFCHQAKSQRMGLMVMLEMVVKWIHHQGKQNVEGNSPRAAHSWNESVTKALQVTLILGACNSKGVTLLKASAKYFYFHVSHHTWHFSHRESISFQNTAPFEEERFCLIMCPPDTLKKFCPYFRLTKVGSLDHQKQMWISQDGV